jgi:exodeoxyribonuclease V gamma subunit
MLTSPGDTLRGMLHVHRAARADRLADALAELLAETPDDPFASDVVAVPTRGMERWLTQRMSAVLGARPGDRDGVCANVLFPTPHRLISDAVAVASDVDPAQDPWLPERSVWPLLDVVEEGLGEPWLAGLAAYLGADCDPPDPARQARRLSVMRDVAGLYDRYALHRPGMLEAWAQGRDADELGAELPAAAIWQAELWRRLRARIGRPGPAERRERARTRLLEQPELLELGERLSLFGLTRLPTGHLQVLSALAHERDVHLFLLHPSPTLWRAVAHLAVDTPTTKPTRAEDPSARLAVNRLLRSWGRDAREMQLVLQGAPGGHAYHDHDLHEAPLQGPGTLLGQIQADIRADRQPPGDPLPGRDDARRTLAKDDHSLQVHSCHGRVRQVEVMRDAILHALAHDPTLEPRDVIVMCPDIETFAPLIQATFGAGERTPDDDGEPDGPVGAETRQIDLRVRLADRALRQTNPVLAVVTQLLELVGRRLTASEVLDLADRAPVRRRFALDDDDLTRLQDWIAQAGIRWGLDAGHRAPFKLDSIGSGTWRSGLDRLLLGVTMTEDDQRLFSGVLPLDDVDSRAIDLAGRFAELVARLGEALDSFSVAQSLSEWAEAIAAAADALAATAPRESWQRAELQRVLDELVDEAGNADGAQLAPAELRAYLGHRLQGRPTRANFRTGHLTVCTLMPMRSVPHRIVCLLGLDDGAFPRKAPRDGDDLLLDEPRIGERDPRSEDRQLLLDALLAATERLIVTYTGNDERTNTPRPPAVPVGELLDTVDATVRLLEQGDRTARERIVIRHPLQPFDPKNFTAGALSGTSSWSFDPVTLEGARALRAPRSQPQPFLDAPLAPSAGRVIELEDLVRFVDHPVRSFLRRRLGISLRGGADEVEDGLTVELDPLGRWGVGQRLLEARLRGVQRRAAGLAEIARGTLPPGVLGKPVIEEIDPVVDAIVREVRNLVGEDSRAEPVDVRLALPDGRLLNGTVAGVYGDVLLTTTYSRVSGKHRLAAWVKLLALTAAWPQRVFSAATLGRASGKDDVRVAIIPALGENPSERATAAAEHLGALLDLYDRGMREPLPIYAKTSAAYARAVSEGQDPVSAAEGEWTTQWRFDKEDRDLEHQLVHGGVIALDDLLAEPPRSDETWAADEDSRLGRCARRLWDDLLSREEVSAR